MPPPALEDGRSLWGSWTNDFEFSAVDQHAKRRSALPGEAVGIGKTTLVDILEQQWAMAEALRERVAGEVGDTG